MTLIRNSTDAYVSEANPSESYPKKRRLYLAGDAATNTRYSFHFFGLPSGLTGCTVHSAVFGFYNGGGDWSGSVTMTARLLGEKFSLATLRWGKQPGVVGTAASLSRTSAAADSLWEINIQPLVQQIADGGQEWFGFRLETSGTVGRYIHSAEADEALRPYLIIEYSEAPEPPDGLWPGDGKAVSATKPVLRWNFIDEAGDTTQANFDLRFFSSQAAATTNTTPTWEVVDYPSTLPEADLNALGYSGLSLDQSVWWRVRVTDGAGLQSQWSEPANFVRRSKGTLTINNPAASPNNVVQDSTPPFSWTFSGRLQQSFEVEIFNLSDPTQKWSSGPLTSSSTTITPPEEIITSLATPYRVVVRVLDDQNRATTPGDSAWVEAVRDFTYTLSSSVASVTGLSSTNDPIRPLRRLDFSRSTAPDEFVIFRNGVEVDSVVPSEVFVSGTSYRYIDRTAPLLQDVTWTVAARVNGVTSTSNPSTTGKVKALTTYLSTLDGSREAFFLNRQRTSSRSDSVAVHRPLGGKTPVVVFQSLGGYEGAISGTLADEVGIDADTQRQNMEWFRQNRGVPLLLTWTNRVVRVVVFNIEDEPVSYPDGTVDYNVDLEFVEV